MPKLNYIFPETSLVSSVYIPDFFKPKKLQYIPSNITTLERDVDFTIEQDIETGLFSIISLNTAPFIDIDKLDNERRLWFYTDKFGNKWRRYADGDYVIENKETHEGNPILISYENLFDGQEKDELNADGNDKNGFVKDWKISKYSPFTIKVEETVLTDITNYLMDQRINPELNNVTPHINKEYYYDFKNKIFTNIDFNMYNDTDIYISYYTNIDNFTVNFNANTNIVNDSLTTPIIDNYIVNMVGQHI